MRFLFLHVLFLFSSSAACAGNFEELGGVLQSNYGKLFINKNEMIGVISQIEKIHNDYARDQDILYNGIQKASKPKDNQKNPSGSAKSHTSSKKQEKVRISIYQVSI